MLQNGIFLGRVKCSRTETLILYQLCSDRTKMQSNTKDLLDLDKRKVNSGQYDTSSPSDSGTWMQLQEGIKAKIHSEQIPKTGKSNK